MNIDLVVFDVAGTTVRDDAAVARFLGESVARRGARPTEDQIRDVMGWAKPVALRALLATRSRPAPTEEEVAEAHACFEDRMVHHYLTSREVEPLGDAETAFVELRAAGVRVALDTGFSRRILNAILLRLGWYEGETLDATVASDEVVHGRPAPDMIRRAMSLTGTSDPKRVAKVGDTVSDVREGLAAECGVVIGVTSGTGSAVELRAANPTMILPDVGSVVSALHMLARIASKRARDAAGKRAAHVLASAQGLHDR